MSEVKTFFRYCPACGRRFHIKLVSKVLVSDDRGDKVRPELLDETAGYNVTGQVIGPTILKADLPVTVQAEDFEYSYRCSHCGHVWKEMQHREAEVR